VTLSGLLIVQSCLSALYCTGDLVSLWLWEGFGAECMQQCLGNALGGLGAPSSISRIFNPTEKLKGEWLLSCRQLNQSLVAVKS
jgi:hypothetical protein